MTEIDKYEVYKTKLRSLCEEHDLVFTLKHNDYPISLTIKPNGGTGEQLSMLAEADEKPYMSPDSALVFIMKDGALSYSISESFTVSDALFSKLKNLFKNLHDCWLQYFFRDLIENKHLSRGSMPVIDESEADIEDEEGEEDEEFSDDIGDEENDLVTAATLLVRMENKASVSLLQRRLGIGYAKAARVMDELEKRGVVGPYNGSDPREVLPSDCPEDEELSGEEE